MQQPTIMIKGKTAIKIFYVVTKTFYAMCGLQNAIKTFLGGCLSG